MLVHFSFLGASWAHFSRRAAFVASFGRFFRVLVRSRLDFGGSGVAPGRVLEPPGPFFSTFFCACALALSECSECGKTTILSVRDTILVGRNTLPKQSERCDKSHQVALPGFFTKLSVPIASNMRLGAHQARLGRGLRASPARLGRILGSLGQALGPLGRRMDS